MEKQSKQRSFWDGSSKDNMEAEISDEIATKIAKEYFGIETLKSRGCGTLDFYDVSVLNIEAALKKAYAAGRGSVESRTEDTYIDRMINSFFYSIKHTGGFDPAMEGEIASALETIIDNVFNDGYDAGHLPIGGRCKLCGICAYNNQENGKAAR